MKKLLLSLTFLLSIHSVYPMQNDDIELTSPIDLLVDQKNLPVDQNQDYIIVINDPDQSTLENPNNACNIKSYLRELVIAGVAGTVAVTLNNLLPASAFLAYGAWGASCKVLMRKVPNSVKIASIFSLIAAGYTLDKIVLPTVLGIGNVGFLPLGVSCGFVVLKKTIKGSKDTIEIQKTKKKKKNKKKKETNEIIEEV